MKIQTCAQPTRQTMAPVVQVLLSGLLLVAGVGQALAQPTSQACGSLQNHYGPYDFRTDRSKLPIVDGAHFTPAVEALVRGKTSMLPGGDLNYTLTAFPNHHRALMSVMRYSEKLKTLNPKDLPMPVECYFERAVRFRPDDVVARMIYATFLVKQKRETEASQQLDIVSANAGDSGFTHYNMGLIYLDMKNYDKALINAHKAERLGFGAPELRNQLKAANQWKDQEAQTPSADEKK